MPLPTPDDPEVDLDLVMGKILDTFGKLMYLRSTRI
jgi:hypothetical protein